MKNKLVNEAEKKDHEIDTFANSHTNEKDVTIAAAERVQTRNPICSYEVDIHQNAKEDKKT